MKKLTCKACSRFWYIEDSSLEALQHCPFCGTKLRQKQIPQTPNTLDVAIYMAYRGLGPNPLASPEKLRGYIMDIAPSMKRDLRILSHSFSEEYFSIVRSAFARELPEAEVELRRLSLLMVEDIGLSETSANQIQSSYLNALRLIRGIGLEEALLAEVQSYQPPAAGTAARSEPNSSELLRQLHSVLWDAAARQATDTATAPRSFPKDFVTDGTKLIRYDGKDKSVCIPEGITVIAPKAFAQNKTLTEIRFPKTLRAVESSAFSSCSLLRKVHFNEGLREIYPCAFSQCIQLETAFLPQSLNKIGFQCFLFCSALTTLHLPGSLSQIPDSAFYGCISLKSVTIPATITSIAKNAFPPGTTLKKAPATTLR